MAAWGGFGEQHFNDPPPPAASSAPRPSGQSPAAAPGPPAASGPGNRLQAKRLGFLLKLSLQLSEYPTGEERDTMGDYHDILQKYNTMNSKRTQ